MSSSGLNAQSLSNYIVYQSEICFGGLLCETDGEDTTGCAEVWVLLSIGETFTGLIAMTLFPKLNTLLVMILRNTCIWFPNKPQLIPNIITHNKSNQLHPNSQQKITKITPKNNIKSYPNSYP